MSQGVISQLQDAQPRAPFPKRVYGRERNFGMLMDQEHPGAAPGALLAPRDGPSARAGLQGVGAIPAEPPPGCGNLSKRADGAGGGGEEQKRLFSHATYFTSRTFCAFQPLPVKASRSQPRDSAVETVSQQRLAATWLLLEGGVPPLTGTFFGVLSTSGPAAPSQSKISAAVS